MLTITDTPLKHLGRLLCLLLCSLLICGNFAQAALDCQEIIDSVDLFLIRQTDWFDSVRPPSQPPLVQTYAWDTEGRPFPPADLDPPPCCKSPCAPTTLQNLVYRGDVYDQSLAAHWFIERARLDFANSRDPNANLGRAKKLLDATIFLEENDPISDGRVRVAYWANNLLNPAGTESSIMAPDASTGSISWFGIALTRFYDLAEKTNYLTPQTRGYYLDVAKEKANWIIDHCKDHKCMGGFTGGYGGWEQIPFTWKSTEHNIDAYVFAQNLFQLTGDPKWEEMAQCASDFVKCMYVPVDDPYACGYYVTGTLDDGCTLNHSPIPADTQAWTALARWDNMKIDSDERAECAMHWLKENLKDGCVCNFITLSDDGVKFSNVGFNMQCEVTASAAFAFLWTDEELEQALAFGELLDWVRLNAGRDDDGILPGIGIVATPCLEGAFTGYNDAWYYNLRHVASSVWAGSACLYMQEGDEWANPLRPIPEPSTMSMLTVGGLALICRRRGRRI